LVESGRVIQNYVGMGMGISLNLNMHLCSVRDDEVYRWMDISGSETVFVAEAILKELSSPVHMGK